VSSSERAVKDCDHIEALILSCKPNWALRARSQESSTQYLICGNTTPAEPFPEKLGRQQQPNILWQTSDDCQRALCSLELTKTDIKPSYDACRSAFLKLTEQIDRDDQVAKGLINICPGYLEISDHASKASQGSRSRPLSRKEYSRFQISAGCHQSGCHTHTHRAGLDTNMPRERYHIMLTMPHSSASRQRRHLYYCCSRDGLMDAQTTGRHSNTWT
jgi:hypothetical protein